MSRSPHTYSYILFGVYSLCFIFGTIQSKKRENKQTKLTRTVLRYNLVDGLGDIIINPDSEKIGHTWSQGSIWEKHLIRKFYSLLPTDQYFVAFDLGAQTGCFSLLAKYFPNSAWHAFEPIQEAAELLRDNLAINNIHNVFVHQVAVARFAGRSTLNMPDMDKWGLATLGPNPLRFTPTIKRTISCINLDSFVDANQIPRVHFMKLDTEGAELPILLGAEKMIARDHPIILMEYYETNMAQCGVLKQEVDAFLARMGYTWEFVSPDDILCTPTH
jgi:FkbM family methyltransferase